MRKLYLILAILAALGLVFFYGGNNFHAVVPGKVYRGAQPSGPDLERLVHDQAIRSVINLRGENTGKSWYDEEIAASRRLGVEHHDIRLGSDRLPPYTELQKLVAALDDTPKPVFVHCEHGADRSGLASALTLMLYGETTPDEAALQYSPLYRVMRLNTTGRLFMNQYRDWLDENGQRHSPGLLRHWVRTRYEDEQGNLAYYVDQVNGTVWQSGTRFEDGYRFQVSRQDALRISGWAIDRKHRSPVKSVDLLMDERRLPGTRYGTPYQGVARYFDDTAYLPSGWSVEADISDWPRQCYRLRLEITRLDGSRWRSPPQAGICLI